MGRRVLAELLADRQPFAIVDGGLSTALERAGHDVRDSLWTARLVRDGPAAVVDAHLAFLNAGADVVITASYQASRAGFERAGTSGEAADSLIASTTALACRAIERFADVSADAAPRSTRRPVVAASVGPYGAVLADGSEYTGAYSLSPDALVEFHAARLTVLVATKPDMLAIETIPGVGEARAIASALGASNAAGALDAWMTFTCRDGAHTVAGDRIEDAAACAASIDSVVAVGINCTAPCHVAELLERAARVTSMPLVAYPNGGQRWDAGAHIWRGVASVEIGSDGMLERWLDAGTRIVGGCCGTGPSEIADLARRRSNWASEHRL